MSHNESYLNIEALRQKEGIRKSEDDRVKRERVTMESNRFEAKEKRKRKKMSVTISLPYLLSTPFSFCDNTSLAATCTG